MGLFSFYTLVLSLEFMIGDTNDPSYDCYDCIYVSANLSFISKY